MLPDRVKVSEGSLMRGVPGNRRERPTTCNSRRWHNDSIQRVSCGLRQSLPSIYLTHGLHNAFHQVALDWLEGPDMDESTPFILCLHGMGGHSQSRYLQLFTQSAKRRGYRSVVYNRRGHGGTSLLPVPLQQQDAEEGGAGMTAAESKPEVQQLQHQTSTMGGKSHASPARPKIFPKHVNMDDMQEVVAHLRNSNPRAPM